jgi:glycosyltransferase involved in cell wall biosynthesis
MKKPSQILRVLQVTCMYPREGDPSMGSFVKSQIDSLVSRGVEVDVLFIRGYKSRWNYLWSMFRVFRRCLQQRYDLVHAHYGLSGLVARAQFFSPVVVSYCGDDLYGHATEQGRPTRTSLFLVMLHKWLSHFVAAIIVKSKAMASLLPVSRAVVIPNGVDFDLFRPIDQKGCRERLGLDKNTRYVLFPYNPKRKRKNYPGVRKAVELLKGRLDRPVEVLVVHGKPNEYLPWYMNAADVMILASCWEGSPNAVKEAMACNLPVVSTAVGDVPELFHGLDGYLLCQATPEDMAERLESILRNPVRTRAREAIEHLRLSRVAEKVLEVYRSIDKKSERA